MLKLVTSLSSGSLSRAVSPTACESVRSSHLKRTRSNERFVRDSDITKAQSELSSSRKRKDWRSRETTQH